MSDISNDWHIPLRDHHFDLIVFGSHGATRKEVTLPLSYFAPFSMESILKELALLCLKGFVAGESIQEFKKLSLFEENGRKTGWYIHIHE